MKLEYLEWDSLFFGVPSYILMIKESDSSKKNDGIWERLDGELESSFITAKIPVDIGNEKINKFMKKGFKYINTEIVLSYMEGQIQEIPFIDKNIVFEKVSDKPKDLNLLGREFSYSRFHMDNNISDDKANDLWEEYTKNFVLSDEQHLFIARDGSETVGAIFVDRSAGENINKLFSVSVKSSHRDKKIGSQLIFKVIDWGQKQSGELCVETQINNSVAIKFYQKNGFLKLKNSTIILHRWCK